MPRLPLTLGGLPGTGTTTACRALSPRLGLEHQYTGQIFRDMAKERGLSLADFGALAETDEAIDRQIDVRQIELLRQGPILLEGRLAGALAAREAIPAYKVWFHADVGVRAARLARREGGTQEERLAEMRQREASEAKRYQAFYRIDLTDFGVYDLVIDTSQRTPEAIADLVAQGYAKATASGSPAHA